MSGLRILHIAQDQKIINAAYYLFEKAFPGLNRFVIIKPPANPPTRYISPTVKAQFGIKSTETMNKLAKMSSDHAVTVLHGLDEFNGAVFIESRVKNRFMTIVYGAEIYNRPSIIGEDVIGEKTKELYESTQRKTIIDSLKDVYRNIVYRGYGDFRNVDKRAVLYNMGVFGSLPSFSYQKMIDNQIYRPTVKKVPFSYYPIDFIIKDKNLRSVGNDMLFGNSASPTNNHLEGFELLKKLDLKERTIFTPLSYGEPQYSKAIISHGKALFPDNFKPLTSFLPLEEYNQILSRCGIVIMNHHRPQAMGNIIASLYMGAKVFMNNTDAYQYLKQLGCTVFLIEDDLIARNQEEVFQLLSDEQVEHNRMILRNELSTSVLVKGMRRSFEEVFDFNVRSMNLNFN